MSGNEYFALVMFTAIAIGFAAAVGLYFLTRADHK